MTTSSDPDEIRAEIERTRAELSGNVDALSETANPKNIANRQVNKVKSAARGVKEHIMGSDDDPYDQGRIGESKSAMADRGSALRDAASNAPETAKRKTRGNPFGAGLIAFGIGYLVSGLIPVSQREQRVVSDVQEKVQQPLKEKASAVAGEMADNLREPAQQAAQSVKDSASGAASAVKEEGQSAKDQVSQQAQDSKETVQAERSS